MPRLTRAVLIRKGRCRSGKTGRQTSDLPVAEQYAHLALRPRRHVYVPATWANHQPVATTTTVTTLTPANQPDEDRITCHHCGTVSTHPDDSNGTADAHDHGWHVYDRDQCGCQPLCPACADQCGTSHSPYFTSYPGVAA